MEFTLFHKGRHTEADIDRRVEEKKEAKNQVARNILHRIVGRRICDTDHEPTACPGLGSMAAWTLFALGKD